MGYRVIGWKSYRFPAPSHVIDSMAGMLNIPLALGEPLHKGWPLLDVEDAPTKKPKSNTTALRLPLK